MFARKKIAKVVATVMAVFPFVLTAPGGSAAADATDDAFLLKLFDDAVNFGEPAIVVKKARLVCDGIASGMSPAEVHQTLLKGSTSVEGSAFSPSQAAVFIADSVQFYCAG